MIDIKNFKKAVYEVRKRYGKPCLSKKELKEAFDLYKQADENKARFQELVRNI